MKIVKLCLVISAIALFIFACSENKPTNTTTANVNKPAANTNTPTNTQPTAAIDELASAKKIYTEKCERCHKADGTGGVVDIEGTKIKAANLTKENLKKDPDSDLIETIEKGDKEEGMPAFKGKLSDEEIKSLVKLIRRDFLKQ